MCCSVLLTVGMLLGSIDVDEPTFGVRAIVSV
jgi:hypothetical protein